MRYIEEGWTEDVRVEVAVPLPLSRPGEAEEEFLVVTVDTSVTDGVPEDEGRVVEGPMKGRWIRLDCQAKSDACCAAEDQLSRRQSYREAMLEDRAERIRQEGL